GILESVSSVSARGSCSRGDVRRPSCSCVQKARQRRISFSLNRTLSEVAFDERTAARTGHSTCSTSCEARNLQFDMEYVRQQQYNGYCWDVENVQNTVYNPYVIGNVCNTGRLRRSGQKRVPNPLSDCCRTLAPTLPVGIPCG